MGRDDVAAVLAAALHEPRTAGRIVYLRSGDTPVAEALEAFLADPASVAALSEGGEFRPREGLEGGMRDQVSCYFHVHERVGGCGGAAPEPERLSAAGEQGERLVVTDRNRPVAELGPAPTHRT